MKTLESHGTSIRIDGLTPGTFIRRLNRFMVEARLEGETVQAHLSNSGRLSSALLPGVKAYFKRCVIHHGRKSLYDLFAVQRVDTTIIVDARFSNLIARTSIESDLFDAFKGCMITKENIEVGGSRLDLLLERGSQRFFVEVKSVTHAVKGVAFFPDAPTARGRRHLRHLTKLAKEGFGSAVLFSVQRPDADLLKPFYEVDREFGDLLHQAYLGNVHIFTLRSTFIPPDIIELRSNVPKFSF